MTATHHSLGEDLLPLTLFSGAALGAAFLSKPRGGESMAYRLATKPKWEVPTAWMGPAWASGYGLLGLSAFFANREGGVARKPASLSLWATYLAMNAVAARFRKTVGATPAKDVVELAVIGAYVAVAKGPARWLALPYLAWIAYNAVTTQVIRRRNPLLSRAF